jgi:hypothetical protein
VRTLLGIRDRRWVSEVTELPSIPSTACHDALGTSIPVQTLSPCHLTTYNDRRARSGYTGVLVRTFFIAFGRAIVGISARLERVNDNEKPESAVAPMPRNITCHLSLINLVASTLAPSTAGLTSDEEEDVASILNSRGRMSRGVLALRIYTSFHKNVLLERPSTFVDDMIRHFDNREWQKIREYDNCK